jgi:ubiquinone/menaquinone biosynthesis C-methylase UbiE
MKDNHRAIDKAATEKTKARYSRIAPVYDLSELLAEQVLQSRFRKYLFAHLEPCKVLEIGVGTGKNLQYYPKAADITAIDISPKMIERARKRSGDLHVTFLEMDAQCLEFPNDTFDVVLATFVFCSVPNPILGLAEARRVCKPTGRLLLLEHVRPEGRFLGELFDVLNPVVQNVLGPEINRRTVENVTKAHWKITAVEDLFSNIVKFVTAVP